MPKGVRSEPPRVTRGPGPHALVVGKDVRAVEAENSTGDVARPALLRFKSFAREKGPVIIEEGPGGVDRLRCRRRSSGAQFRRGKFMAHQGKHSDEGSEPTSITNPAGRGTDQSQRDFELDFFSGIIKRFPDYVDVLRVMGNLLTLKGRYVEGLQIDRRLVQLRPSDALAHYNLACSYALLKRADQALKTLRLAVELGYRDFRYMREDRDLDAVRQDPRFRQILREYESR